MPLESFHPVVRQWFNQNFNDPSEIQSLAWPEILNRRNVLLSAPTGSGKTLAAFMAVLNDLFERRLDGTLEDRTQVVYVSPLKALSNDIHRNLQVPLKGIKALLEQNGYPNADVRAMVRTGDTPGSERAKMIRTPPHILVTTPESLYLLLTSNGGREMLSSAGTLIVDEIHAVAGNKRGAHLSISMERLARLSRNPVHRIGISATQKPIDRMAHFLTGNAEPCKILNIGHRRELELDIELPESPLTAVMANEVWEEIHQSLERTITEHQTTLIFVPTRSMAERLSHHLSDRLGPEVVSAHHGSMSREKRLDAETRLKAGALSALVATGSLELGIDVGSIDLVVQIGSPKAIATLLQRVGRSGHTLEGTPSGKLYPLTKDELVEAVALLDSVRRGELENLPFPEKPLDVLAQQIVAEVASEDSTSEALYDLVRKSSIYRNLSIEEFNGVVQMLVEGFTFRRGTRRSYLHFNPVTRTLRAKKGARLNAIVSGGTIPDQFDYDVRLEPSGVQIGSVHEDFAVESLPGDIFQLGTASWRILKVETGKVRVEDADGLPPTMPFWIGEAPGRSAELSTSVSRVREEVAARINLDELDDNGSGEWKTDAVTWLTDEVGASAEAADQVVTYLAATKASLDLVPSQKHIVMERFFDEVGDQHLVIHSVFGNRLNRAWGLALRKRFCRKFNFELQAAANEESLVLSLGPTHSFPLEEVVGYLNDRTVREVLVQALLDAPMFQARWRWNACTALAVLRRRGGERVPPQIQRSDAEDLLALIFPDQLACLENIPGDREVPDHPLVYQTIHDCLHEAMDVDALERLLQRIHTGEIEVSARDLREPSPMSESILNARPYAFLDDAPLEERRVQAVRTRRRLEPADARKLGKLEQGAIDAVKEEAWPAVTDADELYDVLVMHGFLTDAEITESGDGTWRPLLASLVESGQAVPVDPRDGPKLWIAVERIPQFEVLYGETVGRGATAVHDSIRTFSSEDPEQVLTDVVRGRIELLGPTTASGIAGDMGLSRQRIDQALLALESEGFAIRGHFSPDLPSDAETEWCERRLLARIHRYTLEKLRRAIRPISSSDYVRFLLRWHSLTEGTRKEGPEALKEVLDQLDGFSCPAIAWESDVLPSRIKDYDHLWLDTCCLSGKTMWGRYLRTQSVRAGNTPIRTTPITLVNRTTFAAWPFRPAESGAPVLTPSAQRVLECLKAGGALFYHDILARSKMLRSEIESAIAELVAAGLLTCDSFAGLRALLIPEKFKVRSRRNRGPVFGMEQAGRWSVIEPEFEDEADIEQCARILLKRYGVVFRRVLARENGIPPWRDLVRVLRRMEDRGEVRGGRFVERWGEQYALSEAITVIRSLKREKKRGELVSVSACDPVNLVGVVTPGRRIPAIPGNRILFRDGEPVARYEGKSVHFEMKLNGETAWAFKKSLIRKHVPPKLREYLGKIVLP
jgi:ATP-dependent Lhr-like helicase